MSSTITEFKIQTDVPMPTSRKESVFFPVFAEMQVGDLFEVTGKSQASNARIQAARYDKLHEGVVFKTRKNPANPENVRIWRTA